VKIISNPLEGEVESLISEKNGERLNWIKLGFLFL